MQADVVVQRAQVMYNLTVAVAHTFFVGDGQWLVHNIGCSTKTIIQEFEEQFGRSDTHGLRRHGAGTTLEQQQYRARTGYAPDGVQGAPVNATRFFDNKDLFDAYQRAQASYKPGMRQVDISFDHTVAEGYYKGGKTYGTTSTVRVQFDEGGHIVTSYGLLPGK